MQPINQPGAMNGAQRSLAKVTKQLNSTSEKLATGLRINRGADDPAGLITSENLRGVLAALEAESRSLQRTDHVATTAEGGMSEISDLLVDAEGLAARAADSAGMSPEEQQAIQMELDSVVQSINRIAGSTTFNGDPLLDGTATLTAGDQSVSIEDMNSANLGETEVDGKTYHLADIASGGALSVERGNIEDMQRAISEARSQVATTRGEIGAFQRNAIGSAMSNLSVTMENVTAAESQIRDTDFAKETANLSRLRVVQELAIQGIEMTAARNEATLALLD